MEKSKKLVVTKSDVLINARYFMPLGAQKLLCLGAAKMKEEEITENGITIDVYASELKNITGNQNEYEDLKRYSDQLYEAEFFIPGEGKKYIRKRVVHKAEYAESEARVTLSYDAEIIPFLKKIKGRVIKYLVDTTKSFHNNYSLRFFELLFQHVTDDETEYEIAFDLVELKTMLMLEEKYQVFGDFNRYVIKNVVDELNETTEINNLVCQSVKKGRKVVGLRFTFTTI